MGNPGSLRKKRARLNSARCTVMNMVSQSYRSEMERWAHDMAWCYGSRFDDTAFVDMLYSNLSDQQISKMATGLQRGLEAQSRASEQLNMRMTQ